MDERTLGEIAAQIHLQIAIDGPAGAGKSTVGRSLAHALGCMYLDTGLMYRAVTWSALRQGIPLSGGEDLTALAARTIFSLGPEGSLSVDGRPAGDELRSAQVDAAVSEVSAHPGVRSKLVARQRELASGHCIVMVGRDIGTTVLPDAPVKLWVTASVEERARRRFAEHRPGVEPALDEPTLQLMRERDAYDSGRQTSPLRRAADAVEIHTDRVSPEEALRGVLRVVHCQLERSRTPAP